MNTLSQSFRVYGTQEEKEHVRTSAKACRMSVSAYCRTLLLGGMSTNKQDLEQVDMLIEVVVALSRLGNLMKMLLTNEERLQDMGRDMAVATINGIFADIRFTIEKLREMIDAIHGVPIGDAGEDGDAPLPIGQ